MLLQALHSRVADIVVLLTLILILVLVWMLATGATRVSASLDEEAAAKTKAREALIGSAGMEQLIKMVDGRDAEVRRARQAEIESRVGAEAGDSRQRVGTKVKHTA